MNRAERRVKRATSPRIDGFRLEKKALKVISVKDGVIELRLDEPLKDGDRFLFAWVDVDRGIFTVNFKEKQS